MGHITLHEITDFFAYWVLGWNFIYILLPPRETFSSPKYDKFLTLVSYYGSMNVRKVTTQLYSVVQDAQAAQKPPEVK